MQNRGLKLLSFFEQFVEKGFLLLLVFFIGIIIANSDLKYIHAFLFDANFLIPAPYYPITIDAHALINDLLMCLFFLQIGIEIKHECLHGHLSKASERVLPVAAAAAGVIMPALVYYLINRNNDLALAGWAIPTATDIVFTLSAVNLLGDRVPVELKVFLTALAIIDDLLAILLIACFYTDEILWQYVLGALFCIAVLFILNRSKIYHAYCYILLGLLMWFCFYCAGIHPTFAGFLLGILIPCTNKQSFPAQECNKFLKPLVSYFVLPAFVFANSNIELSGVQFDDSTISLGIIAGLFLGKQTGIFGIIWILRTLKIIKLPGKSTPGQVYGSSILCGVGFTISLFIAALSFEGNYLNAAKLGVVIGSLISAAVGLLVLYHCSARKASQMS